MANPQPDKFTKISNEIMETLIRTNLSGQELRAILFVIRKTYGFQKKDDFIPLTQVAKALVISKIRAQQIMKRLRLMNLLTVKENINGIGIKYRFNKDYEQWDTVKENINRIGKTIQPLRKTLTLPLRKTLTSKERTKETNTKEIVKEIKKEYLDAAALLGELILERKPDYQDVLKVKAEGWIKWGDIIRLMVERDNRKIERIREVIEWCQQDDFWQNNILATSKLRIQFDKLELDMVKKRQRQQEKSVIDPYVNAKKY